MKIKLDGSHRLDVAIWLAPKVTPKCCYTCIDYDSQTGDCTLHGGKPDDEFKEKGCHTWNEGVPYSIDDPRRLDAKKKRELDMLDEDIPF